MRLRNVKNAKEIVENSRFVINHPQEYKGKFHKEIFKNDHPIELEIGMGILLMIKQEKIQILILLE